MFTPFTLHCLKLRSKKSKKATAFLKDEDDPIMDQFAPPVLTVVDYLSCRIKGGFAK